MGVKRPIQRAQQRRLCVGLAVLMPLSFGVTKAAPYAASAASAAPAGGDRAPVSPPASHPEFRRGSSSFAESFSVRLANHNHGWRTPGEPTPPNVTGGRSRGARGDDARQPAVIDETREQRIADVSSDSHFDLPRAALRAYRAAADSVAESDPSCSLSWGVVAAIGQVESDHGRYAGTLVLSDGRTFPHIVGLPLDGSAGVATIGDTDGGQLDGDLVWDRAVGPMQFIPSTWAVLGADGDGNGTRDPHDFDDAALATARYLCGGDVDMRSEADARAAVYRYNHSDDYVSLVLSIADGFDDGVVDVVPNDPTPMASGNPRAAQPPVVADRSSHPGAPRPHQSPRPTSSTHPRHEAPPTRTPDTDSSDPQPRPGQQPSPEPAPAPVPQSQPAPPQPKPHPHAAPVPPTPHPHAAPVPPTPHPHATPVPPKPRPQPQPPAPGPAPAPVPAPHPTPHPVPQPVTTLQGVLVECPGGWCLGEIPLDLGAADQSLAQADYDGDGTAEPVGVELDGLAGRRIPVGLNAKGLVVSVNGEDFVATSTEPATPDPGEATDPGTAPDPGQVPEPGTPTPPETSTPETSVPAAPSPDSSSPAS